MSKDSQFHRDYETIVSKILKSDSMLPARYVFILTNKCNLRCSFCFQYKNRLDNPMATSDWIALIEQIPDYGRITLTGGEPLLHKGFKTIVAYAAQCTDFNIISNGLLLDESTIDFLLAMPRFRVLSISIDNIGNTIRGINDEQWKHLINMLKLFQKKKKQFDSDCILDIKTMVLDENAGSLLQIHQYVMEVIGADTHVFQFLKGSPIQHSDQMFDFNDIVQQPQSQEYSNFNVIMRQLKLVGDYSRAGGKSVFIHPKVMELNGIDDVEKLKLLNERVHDPGLFQTCRYPATSVHINSDGWLFPCLSIPLGNVRDEPLNTIVKGAAFQKFRKLIAKKRTVSACQRCGWLKPVSGNEK